MRRGNVRARVARRCLARPPLPQLPPLPTLTTSPTTTATATTITTATTAAAWFVGGQVAGYSKAYATQSPDSSFQFITVHDAGHMVPTYQPERALAMLQAFLSGTALPGRAQ